jgi:hypothetical protein
MVLKPNIVIALVLFLACVQSTTVYAHPKVDVVKLYNGDRLTGEVKHLYGGILQYSTDGMGTVNIEWQEISALESRFHYEVRTSQGDRLFGSIGSGDRPGQLRVTGAEGVKDLEWLQVVELRPVEDTLIDRFDVYLSAGYSYTKASSVAESSLITQVDYETENARSSMSGRTILTQSDDGSSYSNRYELSRQLWRDRASYFRTFGATYEDNDELDLDSRVSIGGGLGRYFLDTHRTRLIGSAGLQVTNEKFTGSDKTQNVEVFGSADYSIWQFNTPELDLNLRFSLYPSVTDAGRVRSDTDLKLKWEIVEDLVFDITAWATTDNEAESDRQVDYGITTGLGWEL